MAISFVIYLLIFDRGNNLWLHLLIILSTCGTNVRSLSSKTPKYKYWSTNSNSSPLYFSHNSGGLYLGLTPKSIAFVLLAFTVRRFTWHQVNSIYSGYCLASVPYLIHLFQKNKLQCHLHKVITYSLNPIQRGHLCSIGTVSVTYLKDMWYPLPICNFLSRGQVPFYRWFTVEENARERSSLCKSS